LTDHSFFHHHFRVYPVFNCRKPLFQPTNFTLYLPPLKKLIAISFLFIFLCANTELHQLLKLPVLIHHYLSHHQDEHDKSFTHFLDDHYSSTPQHSDIDNHEHDNLPFKTNDCAMAHASIDFVNQGQYTIVNTSTFYIKTSLIYDGVIYSSAFLSSIWQPPKFS
jgi:hypothetical protein